MAVSWSLQRAAPLGEVIARMGFVQFDPIRRPARAQDLILHQRVSGYRAGDLERAYERLGLEEDMLHVYGAMTHDVLRLLHPHSGAEEPEGAAAEVLAFVRERGPTHPRDLDHAFGREQAVNAWGGMSAASTRVLERLHRHGRLRVLRREGGVKVYEPSEPPPHDLSPAERARGLALLLAGLYAPVPERTLRHVVRKAGWSIAGAPRPPAVLAELLDEGLLEAEPIDGIRYLWPPAAAGFADGGASRRVRFLAPFDPVVWDRARFEHLWGWSYRFEAYTPAPKRRFGYYALPVLFGDRVVGWATCEIEDGKLAVDVQHAGAAPAARDYRRGVEREVTRLQAMLAGRG
jgi:uncharacterized protein YcaQ